MTKPFILPKATEPLYATVIAYLTGGGVGGRHIRKAGESGAICGTRAKRWQAIGARDLPIEPTYQSHRRVFESYTKHTPTRPRTPCKRCLAAAEKLRDPLDRLADIKMDDKS